MAKTRACLVICMWFIKNINANSTKEEFKEGYCLEHGRVKNVAGSTPGMPILFTARTRPSPTCVFVLVQISSKKNFEFNSN